MDNESMNPGKVFNKLGVVGLTELEREIILLDLVRETDKHIEWGATVAARARLGLIAKLLEYQDIWYKGHAYDRKE